MAIKRLSNREKSILVICILMIFVYFSFNFIFKPMQNRISLLEGRVRKKERDLRKYLNTIRKSKTADKEYDKYSELFKQKESDEQEMASILSEIESVANEVGLRVSDMKPKKVKKVDFYNNFSVSLSIEGRLDTITHFLHILQNSPHQFGVNEVRFEKRSTRSSKIKCQLILSRGLIL